MEIKGIRGTLLKDGERVTDLERVLVYENKEWVFTAAPDALDRMVGRAKKSDGYSFEPEKVNIFQNTDEMLYKENVIVVYESDSRFVGLNSDESLFSWKKDLYRYEPVIEPETPKTIKTDKLQKIWQLTHDLYNELEDIRPAGGFKTNDAKKD